MCTGFSIGRKQKNHISLLERFFTLSCKYLNKYWDDSYYEGDVGPPGEYVKVRDSKKERRKRRNKIIESSKSYVFNDAGTVATEKRKGATLKPNGFTSFKHNKNSNVRTSTRPQRFFMPPVVCTDFYHQYDDVFKHFEDFNLDEHMVVSGCYDTNYHTIQKQIDCKNFSGRRLPCWDDYLMLKTAIRDTIRKLKIVELGEVNISNIQDFDFNLNKKAGFRYEHYFNAPLKRDCVDIAVEVSRQRYKEIVKASRAEEMIERSKIIPGIYTIGARNARKTKSEPGEDLTSRAVHMPEWHTELHGGVFSDIVTAYLVEKGSGPIYIGNSFVDYTRLQKQLNENFCAIEGDWLKFDASLCNTLVTMSVCILRLFFPNTIYYDNHFLAVLDSLVIKDYHLVGGKVLRMLHGLPSGSKWTSLVGSVLNLIVLNYSFSKVKYNDRSFAIGGDDFVAFIKTSNYDINEIEEDVKIKSEELGMTLKYFKKKMYKNSDDVNDYPVFYKYTVFDNVPIIPFESVLERVLSPWNKIYDSTFKVLKFLDEILPSLAHPSTSCYVYYQFYRYCYYRCTKKVLTTEELVKRHYIIYNKMMNFGISHYDIKDEYVENKRCVFSNESKLSDYAKAVFCLT